MKSREKILLAIAASAVLFWLGLPIVKGIFVTPLTEGRQQLATVTEELARKAKDAKALRTSGAALNQWRSRSLPQTPLDAQRFYQTWLTDLAQVAEFGQLKVTPGQRLLTTEDYTSVQVIVEGEGTLSQLTQFLHHFYRADLLHRLASLSVHTVADSAGSRLRVAMTAEGLALAGVAPRDRLFPRARLAAPFRSQGGKQVIEVSGADAFPDEPDLSIRVGSEYCKVAEKTGPKWTVTGGQEGTQPAAHDEGEIVELVAIHPDYTQRSLADLQELVAHSPFVKPVPMAAPAQDRPSSKPIAPRKDEAAETYLAASISQDGKPQAWLVRRSNPTPIVVQKESQLTVGDLQAVVLDIQADYVLLDYNRGVWRLRLGDTLRTMQRMPDLNATETSSPEAKESIPEEVTESKVDLSPDDIQPAELDNVEPRSSRP